jgi:phosphoglycerol transferase MdoB-like AlkP superfamily enzyme
MKPWTYLRIASVLTLVHSAMHTVGGVFGTAPPGPASVAEAAMKANQFQFMGATRTFWEFHRGLGLAVTIFLTAEGLVFWLLGSLAKRDAAALRPILVVFLLGYLAFAVDSLVYFFALPIVFEALIVLCLGLALAGAKSGTAAR